MFNPFRSRAGRDSPEAAPQPPRDATDAEYGRAWADYVEWSGLDEAKLDSSQSDEPHS